jgi:two-component system chemotaxis response regulator CheB
MAGLKAAGGHTIAESEETAVVWGMPGELVRLGGASEIKRADEIGLTLLERAC